MNENKKTRKYIFGILGTALFVWFLFLPAPAELADAAVAKGYDGRAAMIVIGALLFAICWWFIAMFPWGALIFVSMFFVITLCYRPEKKVSFSKKEITAKAEALGPVSKIESADHNDPPVFYFHAISHFEARSGERWNSKDHAAAHTK